MKWRLTIGAAVVAVVVAVVGCVVSLAGGSTGHPAQRPSAHPARDWLRQHGYLEPGDQFRVYVSDVAETLLGLELDHGAHDDHAANAAFRDEALTQACTYIFGHSGRVDRALDVHRFRFDLQASGPNLSPQLPGGTDHNGYALQCGFSRGRLGEHLLELGVSSGGLTLRNLTTYAQARRRGVTGGLSFNARPRGLAGRPRVRSYLARRLSRAAYLT
jgi:hypothetical protein